MATVKTAKSKNAKPKNEAVKANLSNVAQSKAELPGWLTGTDGEQVNQMSADEEKVLDWVLKGVVGFILAWLGLSIVMVIGGLFHLWG
jgi:hypothetical protein